MHYGHEYGLHLTRGVHATLPPCPPQPPAKSPPPLRSPADRYLIATTQRFLLSSSAARPPDEHMTYAAMIYRVNNPKEQRRPSCPLFIIHGPMISFIDIFHVSS